MTDDRESAGRVRRRDAFLRRGRPGTSPGPVIAGSSPRLVRHVVDGHVEPTSPSRTVGDATRFAGGGPGRVALCFFPAPDEADIDELADTWNLHPLLAEDLHHANQRPKLERYGDVLFLVVRSARYVDEIEDVELSEFHVLVRGGVVALLCQDGRWIDGSAATRFTDGSDEGASSLLDEHLLSMGPEAVVYRLLDAVVDGFTSVVKGLTIDREQIEKQVFSGDRAVTERIYRLSQEVVETLQATTSLTEVVEALRRGQERHGIDEPLQAYLQDVADHLERVDRRVADLRDALDRILDVNATLVGQRQNEDMKKISGWAAILFAPTLVAAIYGMNFEHMPELGWPLGYPLALAGMVAFAGVLYWAFKRNDWM